LAFKLISHAGFSKGDLCDLPKVMIDNEKSGDKLRFDEYLLILR